MQSSRLRCGCGRVGLTFSRWSPIKLYFCDAPKSPWNGRGWATTPPPPKVCKVRIDKDLSPDLGKLPRTALRQYLFSQFSQRMLWAGLCGQTPLPHVAPKVFLPLGQSRKVFKANGLQVKCSIDWG